MTALRQHLQKARSQTGSRRGSVLVIVMITLLFATTALLLFIERASTDLIVHVRDADRINLRMEAYSALETTLAVLAEFEDVLGGLHSPAEGWHDPLSWGDYEPQEGREVKVEFVDESGRMPFAQMDFEMWVRLFESWGLIEADAERWADAFLGWSQEDYTPVSFDAPRPEDYERYDLGFLPPARQPHSLEELRSIDMIRDEFFDEFGQPNEYYQRFSESITFLRYSAPNINAATPAAMVALGRYDEVQQELLNDYLGGAGVYRSRGPGYFTDAGELASVLGDQVDSSGFETTIQALRIIVEVTQGISNYTLSVVISPNGGASANTTPPIPEPPEDGEATEEATSEREPTLASAVKAITGPEGDDELPDSIEYPFTLLSIQEMDAYNAEALRAAAVEF